VGLAFCRVSNGVVLGKGTISNYGSLRSLYGKIGEIVSKLGINHIVVGLPAGSQGEETAQTSLIRRFGAGLKSSLNDVNIEFFDESFSSFEAVNKLKKLGIDYLDIKKTEDEIAAMQILIRWLNLNMQ